jgi:glucokinase
LGADQIGAARSKGIRPCPWTIEANELFTSFGFEEVRLFNDFEAAARSLSHLRPSDLYPLGGGRAVSGAPTAVLGPGTRLGVACLVPGSQTCGVIAGEGGHATMAATNPREDAIIAYLRRQFEHVSSVIRRYAKAGFSTLRKSAMQRTSTSRKSRSNAPHRPLNLTICLHSRDNSPVKKMARVMKRTIGVLRRKALSLGLPLGHRRQNQYFVQ